MIGEAAAAAALPLSEVFMEHLSIDIETYSEVDLSKCGVYRYSEDPSFEILLFAYSVDGGLVRVIDIASGERIPDDILCAIMDDNVIKWAFNSQFERICLSNYIKSIGIKFRSYTGEAGMEFLNPVSWRCSMIWAATLGLPQSLEGVGSALKLDRQKMSEGKSLIKYFSQPCSPTKVNGGRTRNLPRHDPGKWDLFKEYNQVDVQVEMAIQDRLKSFPVPDSIWDEFVIDQTINDRGIMVDMDVVRNAIAINERVKEDAMCRLREITGLENPASVIQMRDWLLQRGTETDSLDKKTVSRLLETATPDLAEVLQLRQQISKSSTKKYEAMQTSVCSDNRLRGMFRFYGANRTGRWSGKYVQLQNLPQNKMPDLEDARHFVKTGDYDALSMYYDSVPGVLSELIRTSFVPRPGYKFVVADFSAIEARVLSYLAGEEWRSEVFSTGGDIYCESASKMFNVPVQKNGINGHLRQKGKIAELALGYGGSTGALVAMGALDMGIEEAELQPLVDAWRNTNPNIVQYWRDIDNAAMQAVKDHSKTVAGTVGFEWRSGLLLVILPSDRKLSYVKPHIGENKFGGESITYMGIDSTKHWSRLETYGAKIVENIVQATSRDILMNALKSLRHFRIVGHVHDEVIAEVPEDVSVKEVCDIMGQAVSWLPGLDLRADGYECMFYMKA